MINLQYFSDLNLIQVDIKIIWQVCVINTANIRY